MGRAPLCTPCTLSWLAITAFAGLARPAVAAEGCKAGLTIPHSNRGPSRPCSGGIGDECSFTCDQGYIPVGRHFCQDYREGGTVFIDHAFYGGRCDRLCPASSSPCKDGAVPMRVNATDNAGNPCLATQCFSVDEALRNLARGNYEVWSLGRSNSTGIYLDNLDLRSLDKRPWASFGCSSMTGLGVLFECVADAMGWRPRVEIQRRVTQSLLALNNKLPGVVIPRNQQGMFPHFFDAETGAAKNPSFGLMNTGLSE